VCQVNNCQLTTIGFYKPAFHAAYTDLNGSNSSLKPNAESFTQTLSLLFGLRLWRGTELYIVPEEISEATLSNLKGLGVGHRRATAESQPRGARLVNGAPQRRRSSVEGIDPSNPRGG
jgi:hypothetical protein